MERDKQGQFINLLIAGKFNIGPWPLFAERHRARVLIAVDGFVPSMTTNPIISRHPFIISLPNNQDIARVNKIIHALDNNFPFHCL